jgi:hypothetical protein
MYLTSLRNDRCNIVSNSISGLRFLWSLHMQRLLGSAYMWFDAQVMSLTWAVTQCLACMAT